MAIFCDSVVCFLMNQGNMDYPMLHVRIVHVSCFQSQLCSLYDLHH